ncbi:hypothetical protein G6F50_018318 [Rhizopus delemar]|uniref:Uncharacterized protein n=1 Tax=Rhizopus delemar TaxID=936053 RepID=A0A9P6XN14_9FUNG|nr:hypothetical protein G6F50_018318 [Rhizopus delemar]
MRGHRHDLLRWNRGRRGPGLRRRYPDQCLAGRCARASQAARVRVSRPGSLRADGSGQPGHHPAAGVTPGARCR